MEFDRMAQPGFDGMGNPAQMGGWQGEATPSYERGTPHDPRFTQGAAPPGAAGVAPAEWNAPAGPGAFPQGGPPPGMGPVPAEWNGQNLDWYQWLNTQWQKPVQPASPTGSDPLSPAARSRSSGSIGRAQMPSTSLSQQQLHKQSTAAAYGPAAMRLFRQPNQRASRSRAGRRSLSPTLMRVGTSGHMQQRATTSQPSEPHQGSLGATMMMRQSAPAGPKASWQGNRRRISAGGRAPALTPIQRRSGSGAASLSPTQQREQRAKRQGELRQRRQQNQKRSGRTPEAHTGPPTAGDAPNRQQQGPGDLTHTRSRTHGDLRAAGGTRGSTAESQRDEVGESSRRRNSESTPEFDDDYTLKLSRRTECVALINQGDALLKQYAIESPLADMTEGEAATVKHAQMTEILVAASGAFQKALALDMNNLKARSGLKRAEGLASKARQRARKIKGLALFQQRYGDRWREMMSLDQEQTDKDLKEVFDMVDDDDSGLLDREEVALVVSFFAGDDEVTEEEIDTAMKQMDEDGSGEVDFEEFIGWWKNKGKAVKFEEDPDTNPDGSPKKKPPPPESERRKLTRQESKAQMDMLSSRDDFEDNLRTIFHKYDDDGSGEIDAEELQGIMENLGVSVTEEEIEKMVLEIDEDGSGTIDFDEFLAMVKKAMADDAGGTGSKLAMAMVEHSFAAMGDEIAWKWQRGTMVQLRNGLWAPVFSEEELKARLSDGAFLPDCVQG